MASRQGRYVDVRPLGFCLGGFSHDKVQAKEQSSVYMLVYTYIYIYTALAANETSIYSLSNTVYFIYISTTLS